MSSDAFVALNQFVRFDAEAFFADKLLTAKSCAPLVEYKDGVQTDNVIGTKVTVGILDDQTDYKPFPDGSTPDNSCKSFDVKLVGKPDFSLPKRCRVELVNPVGVVYAQNGSSARNRLSITADDIKVVQSGRKGPGE